MSDNSRERKMSTAQFILWKIIIIPGLYWLMYAVLILTLDFDFATYFLAFLTIGFVTMMLSDYVNSRKNFGDKRIRIDNKKAANWFFKALWKAVTMALGISVFLLAILRPGEVPYKYEDGYHCFSNVYIVVSIGVYTVSTVFINLLTTRFTRKHKGI